ncbi:NAD-glutamate dehydrogenase [Nocardioides solisilvae]|uniref:NAD-glutamate dehydrogenase n=1 Tax=Nocardioides solisilvae TaxID=1542435 RepID=UPI000D74AA9E|nr:NAD-glutamate dehydrogenase [Nocardioides solisilvae]
MAGDLEEKKSDLLAAAAALVGVEAPDGPGDGPGGVVAGDPALLHAYYRHVAPEDVVERQPGDLHGAWASHHRLAGTRPQGRAVLRVETPVAEEVGWSATGHSVVEIVTDDMPFLVDSVTMELTRLGSGVHRVVHPRFEVTRDLNGGLQSVGPVDETTHVEPDPTSGACVESWMYVEIDRVVDRDEAAAVEENLHRVLQDVRDAVEDWDRMQAEAERVIGGLETDPPDLPADEVAQGRELLRWLVDDHFTFLGYREYRLETEGDDALLRAVPGTGLGILRADPDMTGGGSRLPAIAARKASERTLLVLTKANSRATVHRPAYLDYVGVKTFDADGRVVGERRFLGLLSSRAYAESITRIPLLREKAATVLERVGFDRRSHAGKELMDTLEHYPRDELFHTPVAELVPIAESMMHAGQRRQLRAFLRRDTYGRYVSALVYLPRDRYSTAVRERFAAILREQLDGEHVEFTARVNESVTARVHFVVHPAADHAVTDFDAAAIERLLVEASRSWRDDLRSELVARCGESRGAELARRYGAGFPEAYKEDFSPATAAEDVLRLEGLEQLEGEEGLDLVLVADEDEDRRSQARLKVFRVGPPLSLSEVLPTISSLGVEVVDERPYQLEGLGRTTHVYEFGLRDDRPAVEHAAPLAVETLRAVWAGQHEGDGFNALVLSAGLGWRQVMVLRAYARYMRQGNAPFSLTSIQHALLGNLDIARLLVQLFEARFDPGREGLDADAEARTSLVAVVEERLEAALDDVASLDHDRILRSYRTHVQATLRTNYFRPEDDDPEAGPRPYLSLKLDPSRILSLPEPRPAYEIFVHSPRVEGVHLRFGKVARGGLRWSDRRDDYRTEVLGLVKAQMVKNTVIVPVGAKGGFVAKQLPDPGDREAWLAEGVACYRHFIRGLLDVTDNLVDGRTVPPPSVVRHDGDDSYLVVAADKGTASFSDVANELSRDYGFWLGDAFASGGSVGYDHKGMGITARGAWVSVQRHFRERGIDCQAEDFTCVGIGDMSGDVFGNGMLCSEHIRLVAAFDHRDIFLDPDPDAATSYAERKRLFGLPRSSWRDYDASLISEGGGVHSRDSKSIPVSDAVRRALGIEDDVDAMAPSDLMRAILTAPVDLLWNGGIGTYVKARSESHADAGDKANDAIRVDGADLRAACVGEGGNLGFTQLGRIEYAKEGCGGDGGRINTDFIDNSAGVDTSDHEVNIKILLDKAVADEQLEAEARNALLAEMTDEVAALVLRDNYEQNLALANAAVQAPAMLHVHEDWMRDLEARGVLNRELEALPDRKEVRRRIERGEGLTLPELSVLMAWTKIVLADELLGTELPDDPYLTLDLITYFPQRMHQDHRAQMLAHPLRREIITTQVVNDLVNGAGMTYWTRLGRETGASAAELTRANFVAREIFGSLALRRELEAWDNRLPAGLQTQMRLEMRTLVERASRWLVTHRRPLRSEELVDTLSVPVQRAMATLPQLLTGRELAAFEGRRDRLVEHGVPEELAQRVAVLPTSYALLSVVETAQRESLDPDDVARVHLALGELVGLPSLVQRIQQLPRADRWQTMARAALRDDLFSVHGALTAEALAAAEGSPQERVAAWEARHPDLVRDSVQVLEEIVLDDEADLARMSVALRVVRGLLARG